MITETSAVNFRQNLGEMLNQVQYRHDSVVNNKDGGHGVSVERGHRLSGSAGPPFARQPFGK